MRLFTRYILREIIGYALLGGALFTFILFMKYLLPLMELAVRGAASPAEILKLIGILLPNFLTLTIPMAVLTGILLGLSRLASDSEVTAMRAAGFGVVSFVRIVSLFACTAWILGTVNSLYVAPRAAAALLQYEGRGGQAAAEVQPRVFYEKKKPFVLYVQDTVPSANASVWRHVFLADMSVKSNPRIITANQAVVLGNNTTQTMEMLGGTRHEISATNPDEYNISTFANWDVPLQSPDQEGTHLTRKDTPMQALSLPEVWRHAHLNPDSRPFWIEFHRRFSFPAACLVLMLVGVPLGLSSKRGGKGSGFVLTLLLVFLYYFLSSMGVAFARQSKLPPSIGVWGANLLFGVVGILLIQQMTRGGAFLDLVSTGFSSLFRRLPRRGRKGSHFHIPQSGNALDPVQRVRQTLHFRFPLLLDEYVMGSFLRNFLLVLASLSVLFLIFTFFELIGDIIKYRTPLVTVGDYLLNLIPFVLYNVTPVCSLVAVLVTFGALSRTSEITAMKATGTSLYRLVAPILVVSAVLAVSLFAFDELYLPTANRRQAALRSAIQGKPAQTFSRPDEKWISGQASHSGDPNRIFYYQFFDQEKDVFANISVFEFEPGTFTLTRRIFAASAHWDDHINRWVFENGWGRTFQGETVSSYQPFTLASFPEIHEQPSYFKKEERPSQEMSYTELTTYVRDLRQSGFDTTRLRVQLNRKLAYPLMTFVLALLAVPFALSAGKRGSIAGMGMGIGVAITYWVVSGIFENLGDVASLPAVLAAWSPDVLFLVAATYLLLRVPT